MPLIFFAAVCFSLSYIFWGQLARVGEHYYPLWFLFLILGAVAATGGTVAAFVPEDKTEVRPVETDEYVMIHREKCPVCKQFKYPEIQAVTHEACISVPPGEAETIPLGQKS